MKTVGKRHLLQQASVRTRMSRHDLDVIDRAAVELHDPELLEHATIAKVALLYIADRLEELSDGLEDELERQAASR